MDSEPNAIRRSNRSSGAGLRREGGRHGHRVHNGARASRAGGPPQRIAAGRRRSHDHPPAAAARRPAARAVRGHGRGVQAQAHFSSSAAAWTMASTRGRARCRALSRLRRAPRRGRAGLGRSRALRAHGHDVHVADVPHGSGWARRSWPTARRSSAGRDGRATGTPPGCDRARSRARAQPRVARPRCCSSARDLDPARLERIGGLQAQYARRCTSGCGPGWGLELHALTRAFEPAAWPGNADALDDPPRLGRPTTRRWPWPSSPRGARGGGGQRDGLGARDMSAAARRLRPRARGAATLRRAAVEQLVGKGPARRGRGRRTSCARRRRARGSAAARTFTRSPGLARPGRLDHDEAVGHTVRATWAASPGHACRDRQLGGRPGRHVAPALQRSAAPLAAEAGEELVDLPAPRSPTPRPRRPSGCWVWGAIPRPRTPRRDPPERHQTRVFKCACRSRCHLPGRRRGRGRGAL